MATIQKNFSVGEEYIFFLTSGRMVEGKIISNSSDQDLLLVADDSTFKHPVLVNPHHIIVAVPRGDYDYFRS